MILALGIAVMAGVALPHLVDLQRSPPVIAATLWAVALGLRAATGVTLVLYAGFFFPTTALFDAVTDWCWHAVVPVLTTHLGLEGHVLGGALTAIPALVLAASMISIVVGLFRAGSRVRSVLTGGALGPGPDGTVIVGGSEVVLAAAGFKRPQLVVSAGALVHLDDAELAAGLAHERAHIARSHRWVMVYAELCRGLGRLVPGTSAAKRHLAFHLERDADAWATRHHDPVTLASAICKAAMSHAAPTPGYALLAGPPEVTGRLDELLDRGEPTWNVKSGLLSAAAVLGVGLLVLLSVAVPLAVATAASPSDTVITLQHCFM